MCANNLLARRVGCGMLKQMASGASPGDDGVVDVGVHTLAAGRRKMSIISLPCGSGVKKTIESVLKGEHIKLSNVVRAPRFLCGPRLLHHSCSAQVAPAQSSPATNAPTP